MLTLSTFNSAWTQPREALEGISMIDRIFNRLNGMYPGKFSSAFKDAVAIESWKEAWVLAFEQEGLTPKEAGLGIQNCLRMFDWPPSLPEFLRACRPHLESDVAFFEAVREMAKRAKGETESWSHPAIYHAAVMIGQYDLFNGNYQTLGNRWKAALSAQLSLGQWAEIPPVAAALPAPDRTEGDRNQVRQVKTMANDAINTQSRGSKDWAITILDNPRGRSLAIIRMAKNALGVQEEVRQ